MKKIIIAACMALLGCGSVFAQQGKQAIGGNLSYGTEIESVGIGLKLSLIHISCSHVISATFLRLGSAEPLLILANSSN